MIARVLLDILGPILLLIGCGALLRYKFALDMGTLSKLNIYFFVPFFVFHYVAHSELAGPQMLTIVALTLAQLVILGGFVLLVGLAFGVGRKTLAALLLAVMFYNSGNYGLPLAELAYGAEGSATQTFVLLTQNVTTFTVGLMIAGYAGSGHVGKSFLTVLRLPVIPVLILALAARWWIGQGNELPAVLTTTSRYVANGLVPIALLTLGAQLASNPRWPRWGPVGFAMAVRLVAAPLVMAASLWVFRKLPLDVTLSEPSMELLILTAGTPTAVNTLLTTLEVGGDADLAADCVFWTTVASCVTITVWLLILRPPVAG